MTDLIEQDKFDRLPEKYRRRAREIEARLKEIKVVISPCDTSAIREAAIRLRGQLLPQPEMEMESFAEEFRLACSDLPDWAVFEATNDYLGGRVANHLGRYMPTCAEFAIHARSIVYPFIAEGRALQNEAEKLVQRAEDDARRAAIAIERSDPGIQERVRTMLAKAKAGAPVLSAGRTHTGITPETQAELDKYRRRPKHVSRLANTPIVKGNRA
jgi:hypothetical protein